MNTCYPNEDTDGSGAIDFPEFLVMMMQFLNKPQSEQLTDAFRLGQIP